MKKYIAECFGTYGLVLFGTAAIVLKDQSGGRLTHAGVACVFGLSVAVMILLFGKISGAHINPAVSIALWLAKRFSGKLLLPYIFSQISGAIAGSLTVYFLFSGHPTLGATLPSAGISQSFFIEFFLTFLLIYTVLQTTSRQNHSIMIPSLMIGCLVALEAFFAGPLTGASMNPARSIGPAFISGQFQALWIYILAPIFGACFAVLGCRCLQQKGCCE